MPAYDNYVYTSAPGGDHHRQSPSLSAASRKPSRTASKCYRPQLHRTPAFVLLLAAILSLIGLVEYGVRTLPGQGWNPAKLSVGVELPLRLRPRQAALSSALVSQSASAPATPVGGSASAGAASGGSATAGPSGGGSGGTPTAPVGGSATAGPTGRDTTGSVQGSGGRVDPPASTPPPGSFLKPTIETVAGGARTGPPERGGTESVAPTPRSDSFLSTDKVTVSRGNGGAQSQPSTMTRGSFLNTAVETTDRKQPTPTPNPPTFTKPPDSFLETDINTSQKPAVETKKQEETPSPSTAATKPPDAFLDTAIKTMTAEKAGTPVTPTGGANRPQVTPSESFLETAVIMTSKGGDTVTPPMQQTAASDASASVGDGDKGGDNSGSVGFYETRTSADFLNTNIETSSPTATSNGAGGDSPQPSPRPSDALTDRASTDGATGSKLESTGSGGGTAAGRSSDSQRTTDRDGKTVAAGATPTRGSAGTAKGAGPSATTSADKAKSSAGATAATSKLPSGPGISTISKSPTASGSAKASAAATAGGANRTGARGSSSKVTGTARPKATGNGAKPTAGGGTTPEDGETSDGGDSSGSTSSGAFSSSDPNRPDRGLKRMTGARYAAANYLPIFLAILLRIAVGCMYATTKMMEPFFALSATSSSFSTRESGSSSSDGAPAAAFLHISYLATNNALDPVRALMHGHGTMLAATALYLAASVAAPFSAELLSIARFCFDNSPTTQVCGPEVRINYTVARVLQALLAAAAVLLLLLWFLLERRARLDGRGAGGGVYQDPSSIATLAALLHHPAVLDDLRRVHPDASKAEMLAALAHRRYALGWYVAPSGVERYGVIPAGAGAYMPVQNPSALPPASGRSEGLAEAGRHDGIEWQEKRQAERARQRKQRQRRAFRVARDALLALVTAGTLAILCVCYKNSNPNLALERFMNSQKFGPRFLLAALGMGIYGQWKRIERELVVMEPYRLLAQGSVHERQRRLAGHQNHHSRALLPPPPGPELTILATRTVTPLATLAAAAWHRCRGRRSGDSVVIPAAAAICVLGQLLIIALASIPYSPATLWHAYLASFYVSMGVLSAMLLAQAALALRQWRRPDPPLPRAPNTVGAVWSYLVGAAPLPGVKRENGGGGSLLEDLADLGAASARRRDALIKGMGRAYSLEQCVGADGEVRWTIDYAE